MLEYERRLLLQPSESRTGSGTERPAFSRRIAPSAFVKYLAALRTCLFRHHIHTGYVLHGSCPQDLESLPTFCPVLTAPLAKLFQMTHAARPSDLRATRAFPAESEAPMATAIRDRMDGGHTGSRGAMGAGSPAGSPAATFFQYARRASRLRQRRHCLDSGVHIGPPHFGHTSNGSVVLRYVVTPTAPSVARP